MTEQARRDFVKYSFFKVDPEWRRLPAKERQDSKAQFAEVLGEFSGEGSEPGQLGRPHNLTTDSKGNIYVAEAEPGRRAQKFAFQGYVAP